MVVHGLAGACHLRLVKEKRLVGSSLVLECCFALTRCLSHLPQEWTVGSTALSEERLRELEYTEVWFESLHLPCKQAELDPVTNTAHPLPKSKTQTHSQRCSQNDQRSQSQPVGGSLHLVLFAMQRRRWSKLRVRLSFNAYEWNRVLIISALVEKPPDSRHAKPTLEHARNQSRHRKSAREPSLGSQVAAVSQKHDGKDRRRRWWRMEGAAGGTPVTTVKRGRRSAQEEETRGTSRTRRTAREKADEGKGKAATPLATCITTQGVH